ncbi:MAG: YHS domain-containing protein [Cytophagia bacterium]|nr:YHS domain-containing protein [Cytophagia bacterium]NBW36618.1 YHS domain-containing protein [Cytophagia bacterium]
MRTIVVSLLMLSSSIMMAQTLKGKVFTTSNGAIDGYDVVAYFTEAKPLKGNQQYSHQWEGATWYFTSAKHRDLFKADPKKYAPAFGGFCAYGVSQGYKVKVEADAWDIVDGILYLNYNTEVQKSWKTDKAGYIAKAKSSWTNIKDQ